jgi:CRISPR-associated protein Csa3
MSKLLVSTFYSIEPFMQGFHKFSPDHIIIVCGDDNNKELEKNLESIKKVISTVSKIEVKKLKHYDIYEIAKEMVDILDKNKPKFDEINVNITGGRKTAALGLLYGSYARKSMVNKIVYITEEKNEVIELPKMSYNLGESKLSILEYISKFGRPEVPKLAGKMNKTRGLIYLHIKDLINDGFLNRDMELTMAGKIALL